MVEPYLKNILIKHVLFLFELLFVGLWANRPYFKQKEKNNITKF